MQNMVKNLFIYTRPNECKMALVAPNWQMAHIPLLQKRACIPKNSASLKVKLAQNSYRIIIVVSASAARLGAQVFQDELWRIKAQIAQNKLVVIAIGNATKKALSDVGISAITPKVASNEGVLRISEITALCVDDSVLIWRGVIGRQYLIEQLQIQGVRVDCALLYDTFLPKSSILDMQKLNVSTFAKTAVLISSAQILDNYRSIYGRVHNAQDNIPNTAFITLMPRLTKMVENLPAYAVMINDLHPKTIAQALLYIERNL